MQQVEPIITKLRLQELDEYEPLKRFLLNIRLLMTIIIQIAKNKDIPDHIWSFINFNIVYINRYSTKSCYWFNWMFDTINLSNKQILEIRYLQESEIYTCLPYFIIFSTYLTFQGWIMWIFQFIPCLNTMCLLFVIALYHPDVQLSNQIWNLLQKIL
ncbi:unnamed protein product [Paramecium sonneborni]|uniref:Uncharacterized protein n=1 Tax=Paramecium sonneborni TaxID=65129 RepID=A0A8S1RIY3_9CILI|nr:unnamed protein product [Paramecium sonneborni]